MAALYCTLVLPLVFMLAYSPMCFGDGPIGEPLHGGGNLARNPIERLLDLAERGKYGAHATETRNGVKCDQAGEEFEGERACRYNTQNYLWCYTDRDADKWESCCESKCEYDASYGNWCWVSNTHSFGLWDYCKP